MTFDVESYCSIALGQKQKNRWFINLGSISTFFIHQENVYGPYGSIQVVAGHHPITNWLQLTGDYYY